VDRTAPEDPQRACACPGLTVTDCSTQRSVTAAVLSGVTMAVDTVATHSPMRVAGPNPSLSRRELIVLSKLEQGLTLDEIAERLVVSRNTVKTQVRSLYRKLGVSNRAEAVAVLHLRPEDPVALRRLRGSPADVGSTGADHRPAGADAPASAGSTLHEAPRRTSMADVDSASGAVPTRSFGSDRPRSEQQATESVPCTRLARLAGKREETRRVLDALDCAIAAEVAAERSRGASWTEVAAALGTSRQSARRQFDDGKNRAGGEARQGLPPGGGSPRSGSTVVRDWRG
jgi:LuxR family transcriptional regulator, transcriptional regulator of spore coat protein